MPAGCRGGRAARSEPGTGEGLREPAPGTGSETAAVCRGSLSAGRCPSADGASGRGKEAPTLRSVNPSLTRFVDIAHGGRGAAAGIRYRHLLHRPEGFPRKVKIPLSDGGPGADQGMTGAACEGVSTGPPTAWSAPPARALRHRRVLLRGRSVRRIIITGSTPFRPRNGRGVPSEELGRATMPRSRHPGVCCGPCLPWLRSFPGVCPSPFRSVASCRRIARSRSPVPVRSRGRSRPGPSRRARVLHHEAAPECRDECGSGRDHPRGLGLHRPRSAPGSPLPPHGSAAAVKPAGVRGAPGSGPRELPTGADAPPRRRPWIEPSSAGRIRYFGMKRGPRFRVPSMLPRTIADLSPSGEAPRLRGRLRLRRLPADCRPAGLAVRSGAFAVSYVAC